LKNKDFLLFFESRNTLKREYDMKIGNSNIDFKGLLIDGPAGCHSVEPKIMRLLHVLVDNAGQVMTREDLITAVWGVEYGGDERLSRGISILRKALGDKRGQHTHIVTISRVGYRLIAEINQNDTARGKPRQTEALQNQGRSTLANSETAEALAPSSITANSPKLPALSGNGIAAIAGLIMACIVIGFFVLTGGRAGETLSLQAKMERGFSHIENFTPKGAIHEAQDIFSGILSDDPSHAAARAGLAFAVFREYTDLEHDPALLQRAKAHAEAALREDEHLALANIAVAWAAEFEGKFDRAHEYLDMADILDPDNTLSIEGRYRIYGKQGQNEKAGEVINTAIVTYPNQTLFYTYRGDFLAKKGDFAASETDFRKAVALSPDSARIYAQLAQSLHLQGRTDEAVNIIQEGLKINETALLYNNLGTYLFFQGQYGLAASAFEKTLELSGDTHDYLYWANIGDAYRWSKDKNDEAATAYRRALQLLQVDLDRYPDDNNLKSRAAMFNAKLGNLDKAQSYMDSFDLTSESPSIQLYRSVVTYEILANRTNALKYLEAAIMSNYPMIEILNDPELTLLRQDPAYHRLLAKNQK
jgi:serine/threonine-protein kinase